MTEIVFSSSLEVTRIAAFFVAGLLYITRRQDDTLPLLYLLTVITLNSMVSFVVVSSFMVGVLIYDALTRFFAA